MSKSLLVFHCNYGCISCHFRDKVSYWSIIATFHTTLHLTPPLVGPRRYFVIPFDMEKLESVAIWQWKVWWYV